MSKEEKGIDAILSKKRNINISKSMPPYTNLSLFSKISSKNYISHPKSLMKSAVAMVFRRKVSQGSRFYKTLW